MDSLVLKVTYLKFILINVFYYLKLISVVIHFFDYFCLFYQSFIGYYFI